MTIAIYGGSFNPPHRGHLEAARTVCEQLRPDKLIIMPDNLPPHKEMAANSPSAQERFELCQKCFASLPMAEVSDLELLREGRSYTADTISELKQLYPNDKLCLVMGTDMLLSFEKWYRFTYILENASLAVLARADGDSEGIEVHADYMREKYSAEIIVMPHEPLEMSSSDIRDRLSRRMGADMLVEDVYEQIIRRNFYDALPELHWLRDKAYEYLKPGRIAHVAGCESEAVMLARHWGEDEEAACTAAILHDITKKLPHSEQLLLCDKYGIICDDAERKLPKILHAKTGAAFARELFGIDERIYGAIQWHTTGKPDMSLLEKIIYLADCIEPTREYPSVEKLRALSYEDIDAAMAFALEKSIENIRANGDEPYKDTIEACVWYNSRSK